MELQKINNEILKGFEKLNKIKQTIREWYTKYLSMHKNTELFDSFLYQLKLFDLQYEQYQKMHQFILNRMYGDYYKLLGLIHTYSIQHHFTMTIGDYPIYKDLEPYKVYDIDMVQKINNDIVECIKYVDSIIQTRTHDIEQHREKVNQGLNLDHYVHNSSYQNVLMINQVKLFKNNLETYENYNSTRLNHLLQHLMLFIAQSGETIVNPCIVCNNAIAEYCKECTDRMGIRTTLLNEVYVCEHFSKDDLESVNEAEPVAEPIVEPEPVEEQVPEPVVETVEEPVVEPEPVPEPVEESVVEPVEEPVPEPVVEPVPEPVEEPVVDPEPVPVPVEEPVVEPEPVSEPVEEPVVEPVEEPVPEPVVEPVPEPVVEPVVEPEPVPEPVEEPVVEPEPVPEPVAEPVNIHHLFVIPEDQESSPVEISDVEKKKALTVFKELVHKKMTPKMLLLVKQMLTESNQDTI